VLPPFHFNGMILEPLPEDAECFMTIAVTVLCKAVKRLAVIWQEFLISPAWLTGQYRIKKHLK